MSKTIIGLLILVFAILTFIGLAFSHYYVGYQYERDIGSHMDNAKDMNTPSRMLEELNLAKQGMRNAGLNDNMYGAWIFKKPDNSMAFQYEHLDSIIERVKAVEEWRQKTYGKDSAGMTENLGDVYEAKMTNLRQFIMETTRSDWIARDTWYIKNHFFYYLPVIFVYIALIGLGVIGIVVMVRNCDN